jgi:hypothetical protein
MVSKLAAGYGTLTWPIGSPTSDNTPSTSPLMAPSSNPAGPACTVITRDSGHRIENGHVNIFGQSFGHSE